MMQTILTSETHTIYTLDSDLLYSKLLVLWNLSKPSNSALLSHRQAFTVVTLVTLVGGTP